MYKQPRGPRKHKHSCGSHKAGSAQSSRAQKLSTGHPRGGPGCGRSLTGCRQALREHPEAVNSVQTEEKENRRGGVCTSLPLEASLAGCVGGSRARALGSWDGPLQKAPRGSPPCSTASTSAQAPATGSRAASPLGLPRRGTKATGSPQTPRGSRDHPRACVLSSLSLSALEHNTALWQLFTLFIMTWLPTPWLPRTLDVNDHSSQLRAVPGGEGLPGADKAAFLSCGLPPDTGTGRNPTAETAARDPWHGPSQSQHKV